MPNTPRFLSNYSPVGKSNGHCPQRAIGRGGFPDSGQRAVDYSPTSKKSSLGRERLKRDAADLEGSPFGLDANLAGSDIGTGDAVHLLAVDEDRDGVSPANDLVGIPFADGFLGAGHLPQDAVFPIERLFDRGPAPNPKIALLVMFALTFDAEGPNLVGRIDMNEDPGISRLGEAPLDGDLIVGVRLFGAEITVGFAGASEDAVLDGPDRRRVSVVAQVRDPAGKVLAIEKFNFGRGNDGPNRLFGAKTGGEAEQND